MPIVLAKDLKTQIVYIELPEENIVRWEGAPAKEVIKGVRPRVVVEVTLGSNALLSLAKAARRNRTGRATGGGLIAKIARCF